MRHAHSLIRVQPKSQTVSFDSFLLFLLGLEVVTHTVIIRMIIA
jgi:hypothetical protein